MVDVKARPRMIMALQPCAHPAWPPSPEGDKLEEKPEVWDEVLHDRAAAAGVSIDEA